MNILIQKESPKQKIQQAMAILIKTVLIVNLSRRNLGFIINPKIKISPYYRFSEFKGQYDADAFTDGNQKYNASLVNTGLISTLGYDKGVVTVNYGYDFTKLSYNGYLLGGKFNHIEAYVNHNFTEHLQLLAGLNYQTFHLPKPDTTNNIFSPYASLFIINPVLQWNWVVAIISTTDMVIISLIVSILLIYLKKD